MTEKEKRTILDMRAAGKQYKEIKAELGIDVYALKVFVHRYMYMLAGFIHLPTNSPILLHRIAEGHDDPIVGVLDITGCLHGPQSAKGFQYLRVEY